jgi:hypothetical protein
LGLAQTDGLGDERIGKQGNWTFVKPKLAGLAVISDWMVAMSS